MSVVHVSAAELGAENTGRLLSCGVTLIIEIVLDVRVKPTDRVM